MAETVMNHEEFRKYLSQYNIQLNSITEKKVYLHFPIEGEEEIGVPASLLEKEGLILVDQVTGKSFSANREIVDPEVRTFGEALLRGKKICCIKYLRKFFDLGLKEAKDMYEINEERWLSLLRGYNG